MARKKNAKPDDDKVYEFTFMCAQEGETYEQALSAALEYMAESAACGTLEPTRWTVIGE